MGLKFFDVAERMKSAAGLKNDSELAKSLTITPQALSNFKKKGEIPSDLVIQFSFKYKLLVDWLITGEGPKYREERQNTSIYIEGCEGAASELHSKLDYIYSQGSRRDRSDIRGLIEETYDEITSQKKEKPEDAKRKAS